MESYEGNKLIAEFMGAVAEKWYEPSPIYNQSGIHYKYPLDGIYPDNVRYHADQLLKYDKSWDWLMPVVAKIKILDDIDLDYAKEQLKLFHMIIWAELPTVWQEVVEFITWYNNETNNNGS